MWQKIDSRRPRTPQGAGRRVGSNERAAGAPPQTTWNAKGSGAAFDTLDDVEWRYEAAFLANGVRLGAPKGKDGQDPTVFIAADVENPPSAAADTDDIGWRNLHRLPAAGPQSLPAPSARRLERPVILRNRTDDGEWRRNVSANGKKGTGVVLPKRGRESFSTN